MGYQEGKYNIKAISQMLGIQPGTLRAWERRYQFIAPNRNESGHRLYSDEHLKILKWLISKVNNGFTISQAVSLLENQKMVADEQENDRGATDKDLSNQILEALLHFDETRAQELINYSFSLYTMDKVVTEVLGGIMQKIGDLWESGEITSAHEHFATSILRSRIGMILHTIPHNALLPKALAVCGPGEWHEIGLLIFTLFLRRKGFDVVYLGASIDDDDMREAVDIIKPKFLFLSCTMKDNVEGTIKLAKQFASTNKELEIGLGGHAIDNLDDRVKKEVDHMIVGRLQKDWEKWLKEHI
ncbi:MULTISPECIES: MerR family transcriptional regulator [unclassified Bacillus (in: firmicutes)]|uniref:MerR family transcriptional regulator n=1 Tax=unclassified Bacillus (in: firmicutes) TaxID=185979 RepID=UPI0008E8DBE2|nr:MULTISPECIES: MerR family transcriptional regulator [unclassified Bacillus (in: firmicutes)]SFA98179.1 Methanogenic corrinoid protein MtbC1 [Bacillus sp. UNCCL13]SFQ80872.1 Methanogenic corrinoid protein MtbC1 [Bacillus sp. cl95]